MTRSLLKVGVSAVLSAIFILLVIYRFLAIRSRQGEGEKKSVFVVRGRAKFFFDENHE